MGTTRILGTLDRLCAAYLLKYRVARRVRLSSHEQVDFPIDMPEHPGPDPGWRLRVQLTIT